MKKLTPFISNVLFLILLFASSAISAQNLGEITGKITDDTGEAVPGATVLIKGTTIGTATNFNGIFELGDVPLGPQVLVISFVGFQTTEINVDVQAGILITVNHTLQTSVQELQEVVVIAEADVRYSSLRSSTDRQLINSIKLNEGVLVGVSNEQILKSVDRDASQIVKRIAGVSLVDRFVVVRGMDPRYNLTLVNGIIGPSSEEESRAFSFDAIPARIIDRLEVDKSPGPHIPAMWGGGVIKVFTKSFTTSRQLNIGFSIAPRTGGSSFTNDFVTYDTRGNSDWLANGAKDRRIPALIRQPYFNFPDINQYPFENIALSRSGIQTFTPKKSSHSFDKRANITYYDNFRIGNKTLNSLSAISYTQERFIWRVDQAQNDGDYSLVTNPEQTMDSVLFTEQVTNSSGQQFYKFRPTDIFTDSIHEEQIRIAAVQSFGIEFNDDHNLKTTLFYNRFGTDRVTVRNGTEFQDGNLRNYKDYIYSYTQRDIFMAQLGGYHQMGKHSIDWVGGYARTKNEVPDFQRFRFVSDSLSNPNDYRILTGLDFAGFTSFQTHLVFETVEKSLTARIDYKVNLNKGQYFRAGFYFDRRERSFFSHRYSLENAEITGDRDSGESEILDRPWLTLDSVYSRENFSTDQWYLTRPRRQAGSYFFDDEGKEFYAAYNYPIGTALTVYGGLRYARFNRVLYDQFNVPTLDYALVDGERVELPDQIRQYFLPSISARYHMMEDKLIARFVYGQTIDRPQFREQAGQSSISGGSLQIYNFERNFVFTGNPALDNSLIHNLDFRMEYYPKSSEFISLGFFYKNIQDPILRRVGDLEVFENITITYDNGIDAYAYGIELEIRKRFDNLRVPVLKNMALNLNASRIWSQANYFFNDLSDDVLSLPLQGSSDYLLNAALYWEDLESGTLFSLIYNYIGDRVRDYSNNDFIGDLYEARRTQLDFVYKQRISNSITMKIGAQDILNQARRFYRDQNRTGNYNPGINDALMLTTDRYTSDFETETFKPGTYFSIGFSVDFLKGRSKNEKEDETSDVNN